MPFSENIRELFTSETARNKNSAVLSSLLFFSGWWILMDALANFSASIHVGHIFIGIFGTISFFMVNTVKNSHLSEDNVSSSRARAAKVWLLIGFVMGFSSIISAIWVIIADFSKKDAKNGTWPGVAILLQNVLILIANLTYKFGRNEEDWGY